MSKRYELNKESTQKKLRDNGFHCGAFRKPLYKKYVFLVIKIENDEQGSFICENIEDDKGQIYVPYYDRKYGRNEVRDTVIKHYNRYMRELVKKGILVDTYAEDC